MKLYTKAYIEKTDDDEFLAVASSSLEDRQGEIVDVDGWELDNFKKAPRLLWGHDHKELPIGKVSKIWLEKSDGKTQLMFKPVFQTVTDKGKAIKELVKQGFLNTFSVGFQPIDSEHAEDAKSGVKFTKQELLEISLVNVPANPDAMMLAYKSLSNTYSDTVLEEVGIPAGILKEMDLIKSELGKVKDLAESAVKGLQHLNPHQGRSQIAKDRAFMLKVIAKTADKELTVRKGESARRIRIIKRATDNLIRSNKGDL